MCSYWLRLSREDDGLLNQACIDVSSADTTHFVHTNLLDLQHDSSDPSYFVNSRLICKIEPTVAAYSSCKRQTSMQESSRIFL
jgi:hypothetical protein